MRVTNSMLVSSFLNNLNNNMNRLGKLQEQMTSGKTYANVSDDPVAVIYSHQATQRIRRLEFYQRNLDSAKSWLTTAESGMMELNEIIKKASEATVDNAEDIMTDVDKKNAAAYIGQLRDQIVSALNTAYGLKHAFGGYNTTGTNNASGGITPPFDVRNGNLHYNGVDLTDPANAAVISNLQADLLTFDVGLGIELGVTVNGIDAVIFGTEYDAGGNVVKYNNLYNLLDDLYNAMTVGESIGDVLGSIESALTGGAISDDANALMDVLQNALKDKVSGLDETQTGNELGDLADMRRKEERINNMMDELRGLLLAGPPAKPPAEASAQELADWENEKETWLNSTNFLLDSLRGAVNDGSMLHNPAAINGVIGALEAEVATQDTDPSPVWSPSAADNLFGGLRSAFDQIDWFTEVKDKFDALKSYIDTSVPATLDINIGPRGEYIGSFIRPLQAAQEHLLGRVAEIGGKTNRIDMLISRYDQDEINYYQMLSDAEDADMAEVIMNFKMAESVYNAALSAGASIIQPTLMDFLR